MCVGEGEQRFLSCLGSPNAALYLPPMMSAQLCRSVHEGPVSALELKGNTILLHTHKHRRAGVEIGKLCILRNFFWQHELGHC